MSEEAEILREIRDIVTGPEAQRLSARLDGMERRLEDLSASLQDAGPGAEALSALRERIERLEVNTIETLDRWRQRWTERLTTLETELGEQLRDAMAKTAAALCQADQQGEVRAKDLAASLQETSDAAAAERAGLHKRLQEDVAKMIERSTLANPSVPETLPAAWLAALQRVEALGEDLHQMVRAGLSDVREELGTIHAARDETASYVRAALGNATAARGRLRDELQSLRRELAVGQAPPAPGVN